MIKKIIEFIKKYWKIITGLVMGLLTFIAGSLFIYFALHKKDIFENSDYEKAVAKAKEDKIKNENKINNTDYNSFNGNGTIKSKRSGKD
jgi:hypothetical protein